MITVNLNKAKEITKERLRVERKPLLEAQDVLFMKAQEDGADTTDIAKEKQRLRDITKLADSAKTTDELKTIEVN
jgi:predicted RNA-binding protein